MYFIVISVMCIQRNETLSAMSYSRTLSNLTILFLDDITLNGMEQKVKTLIITNSVLLRHPMHAY